MKKDIKKLSFWISICCVVLGFVQTICSYFGVEFFANIIIDAVALLLSVLVCVGVLKRKGKNSNEQTFDEIKEEIADEIKSNLNGNNKNFDDLERKEAVEDAVSNENLVGKDFVDKYENKIKEDLSRNTDISGEAMEISKLNQKNNLMEKRK